MKVLFQIFLFLSIFGTSCNGSNQEPNTFEDKILKARLFDIEVVENKLTAKIAIRNKAPKRIYFRLMDFIFTSKNDFGKRPESGKVPPIEDWEIPNYEKLSLKEKDAAKLHKMMRRSMDAVSVKHNWISKLSLAPNEQIIKELELEFEHEIEIEFLDFFFNGWHSLESAF